jgi:surface protein
MHNMFYAAPVFNGDLSGWNTSKVIDMGSMFYNNSAFVGGGLENWDTANVSAMQKMFYGARAFSRDLSGWDVDAVTNHDNFSTNSGLTTEQLPKFQ